MKTKRKLKGMTLMEVVVSLAVYAVIGLLIAEIMTLVNATMKATNQLNRRLSYEAKFADNFLYNDGVDPGGFEHTGVHVTLSDSGGHFNLTSPGMVFTTNTKSMENPEHNLIINPNTNYRFLVFTRSGATVQTTIPVFYVHLNLGTSLSSNPITKIIVEGEGVPNFGGTYEIGRVDGPLYSKQILTDFNAMAHHPGRDVSNASFDVKDTTEIEHDLQNLESITSGEIVTIPVPAADAQGHAILPPDDPNDPDAKHAQVKGHLVVKIYRTIADQTGKEYNWYTRKDWETISIGYPNPYDPVVDGHGFPAAATLTLDFVLSAENPNTGVRSFFPGVTYVWNPNLDPTNPDYLVVEESVAAN